MRGHDIHALSGVYAIDALDDIERTQFDRHMRNCPACQVEVAELRETASLLAWDASVEPPAHLRAKVLTGIQHVRPLPPVVASEKRRPGRWRSALVAAVAVAVAVVGTAAVLDHVRQDTTVVASPVDRVLSADDAQRMVMELPGATSAELVRSVSQGRAVLVTNDLKPAPAGHTYTLWLQTPDDDMVPAGHVSEGNQQVMLSGDAAEAIGAGITVETDPDATAPTSAPIAAISFG